MTSYSDDVKAEIAADWAHGSYTLTILQYPDDHEQNGGSYDLFSPWTLPNSILVTTYVVLIIYDASENRFGHTHGADIGEGNGSMELWAISKAELVSAMAEMHSLSQAITGDYFRVNDPQFQAWENKWFAPIRFEWRRTVVHT